MTATAARSAPTTSVWNSPVTTYYLLVASTSILVLMGLAVVLSSSSIFSIRQSSGNPYTLFLVQVAALTVGLVALAVGSRLKIATWKRLAPIVLLVSIGLLIAVMFVGVTAGGNRNWIRVAGMTLQPSEIAKLGLALYLGVVLSTFRRKLTTVKNILVPGGIATAIVVALVLAGRDMGTATVIVMIALAAFWVAGVPLRFFTVGAIATFVIGLFVLTLQPSRSRRIEEWLSDDCDPLGGCMQSVHATYALASGGLWGLGPGMSREKWGYLPAADDDFILAILGEEFGLIGTLLVLVAFGIMLIAINRIVHRHSDAFVQITAGAIGMWIIGQAALNIAVVIGFAPVTGRPLPLVSSGGSSLVASLAAIGVLMAFARREPGAQEAFNARPSVMKRSLAVMSRGRRG